jgi:hypothetical protein
MSIIRQEKLDFWISKNYNVLFVGRHGVGKTSIIKAAFEQAGIRWKYFSASTMDPWVDFIGVPREQQDERGPYLDIIRPKEFQHDEVEALFFDEFNRSPKKVRNAVMELMQFKSINGKKFNNLKMVWAAINPEESEDSAMAYQVEDLDPAQRDRFQIEYEIPYAPDKEYFRNKYGSEKAAVAIEWWQKLDNKIKLNLSPRRLDYALTVFMDGGDIRDALPRDCNPSKLMQELQQGSYSNKLKLLLNNNIPAEIEEYLLVENNYSNSIGWILKNEERFNVFMPHAPKEKLALAISQGGQRVVTYAAKSAQKVEKFQHVLKELLSARGNKALKETINNALQVHAPQIAVTDAPVDFRLGNVNSTSSWEDLSQKAEIPNTYLRRKFYEEILVPKASGLFSNIVKINESSLLAAFDSFYKIIKKTQSGTLKKKDFASIPKFFQAICDEIVKRNIVPTIHKNYGGKSGLRHLRKKFQALYPSGSASVSSLI